MNVPHLNHRLYACDFETFSNSLFLEFQTDRMGNLRAEILADYAIAAIHWEDVDLGDRSRFILGVLPFMTTDERYNYVMPILSNSKYIVDNDPLGMGSLSLND